MELEILSIKNKARIKVMALYLYHTSFLKVIFAILDGLLLFVVDFIKLHMAG